MHVEYFARCAAVEFYNVRIRYWYCAPIWTITSFGIASYFHIIIVDVVVMFHSITFQFNVLTGYNRQVIFFQIVNFLKSPPSLCINANLFKYRNYTRVEHFSQLLCCCQGYSLINCMKRLVVSSRYDLLRSLLKHLKLKVN